MKNIILLTLITTAQCYGMQNFDPESQKPLIEQQQSCISSCCQLLPDAKTAVAYTALAGFGFYSGWSTANYFTSTIWIKALSGSGFAIVQPRSIWVGLRKIKTKIAENEYERFSEILTNLNSAKNDKIPNSIAQYMLERIKEAQDIHPNEKEKNKFDQLKEKVQNNINGRILIRN